MMRFCPSEALSRQRLRPPTTPEKQAVGSPGAPTETFEAFFRRRSTTRSFVAAIALAARPCSLCKRHRYLEKSAPEGPPK